MAPVKSLKTYSRLTSKQECVVVDAHKLSKRVAFKNAKSKGKWKAKGPISSGPQLSSSSLNVTVNDTFDRLLKGELCQPVVFSNKPNKFTSDEDTSKSKDDLVPVVLSTIIYSPVVRRKKRKKRNAPVKRVDIACNTAKNDTLAKSVHYSLEVEKCSISAVHRYNNFTLNRTGIAGGLSAEQSSENISFDIPKICSTPLTINLTPLKPFNRNDCKTELGSPVTSKRECYAVQQVSTENLSTFRLRFLKDNDPKLLMVPRVHIGINAVNSGSNNIDHSSLLITDADGHNEEDQSIKLHNASVSLSPPKKHDNIDPKLLMIPVVNLTANALNCDEFTSQQSCSYVSGESQSSDTKQRQTCGSCVAEGVSHETQDATSVLFSPLREEKNSSDLIKNEADNVYDRFLGFEHSTPLKAGHLRHLKSVSVKTEDISDLITSSSAHTNEIYSDTDVNIDYLSSQSEQKKSVCKDASTSAEEDNR